MRRRPSNFHKLIRNLRKAEEAAAWVKYPDGDMEHGFYFVRVDVEPETWWVEEVIECPVSAESGFFTGGGGIHLFCDMPETPGAYGLDDLEFQGPIEPLGNEP